MIQIRWKCCRELSNWGGAWLKNCPFLYKERKRKWWSSSVMNVQKFWAKIQLATMPKRPSQWWPFWVGTSLLYTVQLFPSPAELYQRPKTWLFLWGFPQPPFVPVCSSIIGSCFYCCCSCPEFLLSQKYFRTLQGKPAWSPQWKTGGARNLNYSKSTLHISDEGPVVFYSCLGHLLWHEKGRI